MRDFLATAVAIIFSIISTSCAAQGGSTIPTSAPLQTDSFARTSQAAIGSVFRVTCPELSTYGTGFLHKSGNVITAQHVVDGCKKLILYRYDNSIVKVTVIKESKDTDLAILKPEHKIEAPALTISSTPQIQSGSAISFWGFPSGYNGIPPLVSVGFLSGIDAVTMPNNKVATQWVVNAAVNHGNSGGPVVLVETGEVIGVADNKIAPLSPTAISALNALQAQGSGFVYPATLPDGSTKTFSEGQVVAMVLEELRQQVQLVIGHAVHLGDLRKFLTDSGIEP